LPAEEFWLQGGQAIICVFSSASTFDLLQCYLCVIPKLHDPEGIHQGLNLLLGKLGTQSGHVGMLNTSMGGGGGGGGGGGCPPPPPPPPYNLVSYQRSTISLHHRQEHYMTETLLLKNDSVESQICTVHKTKCYTTIHTNWNGTLSHTSSGASPPPKI